MKTCLAKILCLIVLAGCAAPPTLSPSPQYAGVAPTGRPALHPTSVPSATQLFISHAFRTTFELPAEMPLKVSNFLVGTQLPTEEPYHSGGKVIQIAGVPDSTVSLKQACEREAAGEWNETGYGPDPHIKELSINGQAACLILFAQDSVPASAALVVQYPKAFRHRGFDRTFAYGIVRAHPDWIQGIAATLQFSVEPDDYLKSALAYMEQQSMYADRVDWYALRTELLQKDMTWSQAHRSMKHALRQLGDIHGYLFSVSEAEQGFGQPATSPELELPTGEVIQQVIGYMKLPGVTGNLEVVDRYASTAQGLIREIDRSRPCGWVVDLRSDGGGNMYPMLVGIGPLLGEGKMFAFASKNGSDWYSYQDGQVLMNGDTVVLPVKLDRQPYELQTPMPTVAVLTAPHTASSGEVITVAFRSRPNTRSFGQPTRGFTTTIGGFELFDGWMLGVSVGWYVDRNENNYIAERINPDEVVSSSETLDVAINWLLAQPRCAQKP